MTRCAAKAAAAAGALPFLFLILGCAGEDPILPKSAAGFDSAAASQSDLPRDTLDGTSSLRKIGPLSTPYYESSPAQGRPPDGELKAGTIVRLEEQAGSYSRAAWRSKSIWLPTDALQPLPPERQDLRKIPMH